MSKETAMAFVKASENDSVLLEKIKAATSPIEVVKIAEEYGYELTEQEIKAIQSGTRKDLEDEDLSEKQLEAVAGGSCCCGKVSCQCVPN